MCSLSAAGFLKEIVEYSNSGAGDHILSYLSVIVAKINSGYVPFAI